MPEPESSVVADDEICTLAACAQARRERDEAIERQLGPTIICGVESQPQPQALVPATRVEITADRPGLEIIKVGGHMLPVTAARLTVDVMLDMPYLELHLPVVDGLIVGLDAHADLAEESRAALVAMGWTPPPQDTQ